MRGMTFESLRESNVKRCEGAFHPIMDWTPTDWACAMAGEAGETCNMVKKLRRLDNPASIFKQTQNNTDAEHIKEQIGKEVADTVIYCDLLMARPGLSLSDAVRNKFNEVSMRVGSHVTL